MIAVILAAGVLLWLGWVFSHPLPANQATLDMVVQDREVSITDMGPYYDISSSTQQSHNGLIIYPGALADPRAYIATYAALAKTNAVEVFVIKAPLYLALFDINGAEGVMENNTDIQNWYVAGHSLGGVAACDFTRQNPSKVKVLILLASFCNGSAADLQVPVISISGTQDGLATSAKISARKVDLPPTTRYIVLPGLNHTQFGDFSGLFSGDNTSKISQAEANARLANAIKGVIAQP